jgi:hypothetical protein
MPLSCHGLPQQPPNFLRALWDMLDDPKNSAHIVWDDRGRSFEVKSPKCLASAVLAQHFRHSNFSSFQRQLNYYGFRKSGTGCKGIAYSHDLFTRDTPAAMLHIQRKTSHPKRGASSSENRAPLPQQGAGAGAGASHQALRITPPAQQGTRFSSRKRHRKSFADYDEGASAAGSPDDRGPHQKQPQGDQRPPMPTLTPLSLPPLQQPQTHRAAAKQEEREGEEEKEAEEKILTASQPCRSASSAAATSSTAFTSTAPGHGGALRIATATAASSASPHASPKGAAVVPLPAQWSVPAPAPSNLPARPSCTKWEDAEGWFCHDPGLIALSPVMNLPALSSQGWQQQQQQHQQPPPPLPPPPPPPLQLGLSPGGGPARGIMVPAKKSKAAVNAHYR